MRIFDALQKKETAKTEKPRPVALSPAQAKAAPSAAPFLLQLDPAMSRAVETERIKRGLKSRAETIRALLAIALT